jgi:hypothetical protein
MAESLDRVSIGQLKPRPQYLKQVLQMPENLTLASNFVLKTHQYPLSCPDHLPAHQIVHAEIVDLAPSHFYLFEHVKALLRRESFRTGTIVIHRLRAFGGSSKRGP